MAETPIETIVAYAGDITVEEELASGWLL